jgi:hypothetical protein
MNHEAIYKAYPEVVKIDDSTGAFDESGNQVELDDKLIEQTSKQLDLEAKAEAKAKAQAKAELLERLGITADEAKLLLA